MLRGLTYHALLGLCLVMLPSQGWGAVAFIDEQHQDTAATTSFAFTASIATGQAGVLVIGCASGLCASLGVTDNGSNTWTAQAGASNGGAIATYTCVNATGNATTITITTTSQPLVASLMRYSGVSAVGNTNNGTSAGSTNPTVTLTLQETGNYSVGGWTTNAEPGVVVAQNGTIRLNEFSSAQGSTLNTSIDNTGSAGAITISSTHDNSTPWWIGAVELRAAAATRSSGMLLGVGP